MNKIVLFSIFLILGCIINTENTRSFQFIYEVNIESTDGQKLEVWLPIPQSNEVQTISAFQINSNGLRYNIEDEKVHNNKYMYINQQEGTTRPTKITMTFNVLRREHQNINYNNVNPHKYLGPYNTVPIGDIFNKIDNCFKNPNGE